jgi:hypothetical protein
MNDTTHTVKVYATIEGRWYAVTVDVEDIAAGHDPRVAVNDRDGIVYGPGVASDMGPRVPESTRAAVKRALRIARYAATLGELPCGVEGAA